MLVSSEDCHVAGVRVPHMHPVTFDGCFGWFHPSVMDGDTAALLCPGLSQDASTGYRSYRQLADRLAVAGYPTLRFDYPGTGDSCDTPAELWLAWQDSIRHALDWLHVHVGTSRAVLFGLRIGATLATVVAEHRADVAGLVLLAPVLRGKSYVNQMALEARLRSAVSLGEGGDIALGELTLSGETQRLMSRAHLATIEVPRDCPIAVFAPTKTQVLSACVEAWRARGADVACKGFDGLEALLRPTQQADEPPAVFSAIMTWLRQACPWRPATAFAMPPSVRHVLTPDGCIETALRFGGDGHLCGIFCTPAQEAMADMAVVLANSGGNPHHGFARFAVEFARYLARAGIASLRIDFAGLGDSRNSWHDDGPTHVFEVDRTADMRAAVDRLQDLGCRRFAAFGLCSGAYHALHAGLADSRFETLLLINLPWLTLRHEKAGPTSNARRYMDQLAQAGTRTLLLFSETDPGLRQVERHFGPRGEELHRSASAAVEIWPGWDHELTGQAMQRAASERLLRFLVA